MTKYSIAIRTLGTSGEKFVRELESIKRQTVQPEKVVIYIAEGYDRPDYTIGKEEYVWVKKGMVAQRVLRYDEIGSPLILLLDDDVELANDSAERMISALNENNLDCIAADTFGNQDMSLKQKLYAAVTNLVFPHWSDTWAFKIHYNGSFSYNNKITKAIYLSQSAAGPAALWKKQVFLDLHLEDELWLDRFGFSYGDDGLIFNKLYKNGYRLGVHYSSGIKNLDAKSSSETFQKDIKKFYIRSIVSFLVWYRTCFRLNGLPFYKQMCAALSYGFKLLWLIFVHAAASVYLFSPKVLSNYIKGVLDGMRMIQSSDFKRIPNFMLR